MARSIILLAGLLAVGCAALSAAQAQPRAELLDEPEQVLTVRSDTGYNSPDVLRKLQEMDPEVERFAGYIATVSPAIFATYALVGSLGCFLMFCFTCAFTACCTVALLPYEICTGGSCCPCLPCL